jgi:hypothetical protein
LGKYLPASCHWTLDSLTKVWYPSYIRPIFVVDLIMNSNVHLHIFAIVRHCGEGVNGLAQSLISFMFSLRCGISFAGGTSPPKDNVFP